MSLAKFDEYVIREGFSRIAGVDEAGRGPLAGPVVAAACIIPRGLEIDFIDDSKALIEEERNELYCILINHPEIIYGIGVADAATIDRKNILAATFEAMVFAIEQLSEKPDLVLFDGKFIPKIPIPSEGIIKGDSKSQAIAAASILAKCTRDKFMLEYHRKWPEYGFDKHKGYGTDEHLAAIKKYGIIPFVHRRTFDPIQTLLIPDFFQPVLTTREK